MRPINVVLSCLLAISLASAVSAQEATPTTDSAPATPAAEPTPEPAVEPTPEPAAEPTPEPAEAPAKVAKVGYKKGFFIESADGLYKLKINGRVQVRHDTEVNEADDDQAKFLIPRARLKMGGHAFDKALSYEFQADFGKGEETLKDFYVDYTIVDEWLQVRAGQTKRPFTRQQLTSSGKQLLADRAITDKTFGAGRDIGLMLHNGFGKKNAFEYAVGLFNGTGDKGTFSGELEGGAIEDGATDGTTVTGTATGDVTGKFSNVPDMFGPMLVMRAGYNYGGLKRYSDGDFEGGDFRFGVAAGSQVLFDTPNGTDGRMDVSVDATVKVAGFSLDTEFFMRTEQDEAEADDDDPSTPAPIEPGFADQSLTQTGVYAQAGYVIADHYLPVVRYERFMPEGDNNDEQVITAGFGAFVFKHNLKIQTEASMITTETFDDATNTAGSTTDWRVRTQLQLAF